MEVNLASMRRSLIQWVGSYAVDHYAAGRQDRAEDSAWIARNKERSARHQVWFARHQVWFASHQVGTNGYRDGGD
jgi:hypothetical protein